jgi:hypothetical protein
MTTTLPIIKATIRWKADPITKQMTLNTEEVTFAIKQAEWEGREDEHPLDDEIFFWLDPEEADKLCGGYDMGDWKVVRVKSHREITVYPPEMTQYLDQLKENVKKKQLLIKELETMVKEGVPNVSTNN